MNTLYVSRTLWDFALLSTVLLLVVLVVQSLLKQPALRNSLAWATTLALLALAILTAVPNEARFSLTSSDPPTLSHNYEPLVGEATQRDVGLPPRIPNGSLTATPHLPTDPAVQTIVIDWALVAMYVFASGSLVVLCWLTLGAWQVRRLRAAATPPAAEIRQLFDQLALHQGKRIQLGVLADLPVAVAVGLCRPAILLPQTLVTQANREELRSVLAHELAHIQHRDLWLLVLLRGLLVLLWAHPLFWLLRSRVRIDQEILADAAAAELTSRATYAEQLVALARSAAESRVPRMASSVGLWENRTQLTERIKLLLDERFTILRSCPRRWRVGSTGMLAALVMGLSLVTVSPAETKENQSTEKANVGSAETVTQEKTANDDFRTMEVRIMDEAGEPLGGAKLYVGVWYTEGYEGEKVPKEYFADAQGVVRVKLPRRLHILRLWPSNPGFVPEFTNFAEGSHDEGLLIPDRYEFKLAKGATLGGTIVDDASQPVAGATVEVSVDDGIYETWDVNPEPTVSTWLTSNDLAGGPAITDQEGNWQINNAPAPTDGKDYEFRLKITHPDFAGDTEYGGLQSQQQITTDDLRAGTAKVVLSRGQAVKGVVVDAAGEPVTDGYVVWGHHPISGDDKQFETRLDAMGGFVTAPLSLGEHAFTVIAPGFMPLHQNVEVKSSMGGLRFELKPGKRLLVKVVDSDGKPIPNAYFHVGSWSAVEEPFDGGQSSVLHSRIPKNAGEDGVYRWPGAPADAITFRVSARDFAAKTVSLTATDAEHVVELSPALVVFGKVTDEKSGKPIETFNVVPLYTGGFGLLTEWKLGTVTGQEARYEIRLDTISDYTKDYRLRFEATGYVSQVSEETFNVADGRVEYDVALIPAEAER